MCLMCEYYLASCDEPECVEKAKNTDGGWNYFRGRTIETSLWRGYGEPCKHIKADYPDWEEELEE